MSKNFLVLGYGFKIKPLAAAPSPASDGDVYYDSTLSTFRIRESGKWNDIGGTTLQQAYDSEAGAEVTITVGSAPLVIDGLLSEPLHVERGLRLQSSSSGYVNLNVDGAATQNYTLTLPLVAPDTKSLPTVASTGTITWQSFADLSAYTYEVHVAKNGSNSGSTGKPTQPFLTIAAAVSYVESTYTSNETIVIYIHPGTYAEDITITRPRTHLIGIQNTTAFISHIGSVTFAPTTMVDNVYSSSFSAQGLLLSAPSSASSALTVGGSAECSVHLRNVYLFADDANQKGLTVTNSGSNPCRLYFNDILVNNQLCGATAVDLSNSVSQIRNATVYSGTATCLKLSASASALAAFCLLETSGSLAIDLGATSLTLSTSSITSSGSNASGVNVAAGATYTTIQNFYNVASGSGYAINGATGGVVTHALNAFAYGSNSKYKNVLTLLAHTTTMTSAS